METKLKIFVGENECYKQSVEAVFLKQLDKSQFEVTIRDYGEILGGFDIYLLHVSHFNVEQIRDLQEASPHSIIMLRSQTSDSLYVHSWARKEELSVNGFYTPLMKARGLEQDLAKKCLQKLNMVPVR